MAKKAPAKAKRINWKQRVADGEEALLTCEEARLAVHKNLANVGFALVKEKAAHRKALTDLMASERKLARAITAIDSAVEFISLHDLPGTATTFRMIANDLRQRRGETDFCTMAAKDEQV